MIEAWMKEQLRDLPGWMPTLYWPSASHGPRVVLVAPDYRRQIGRNGETVEIALASAIISAKAGDRQ